MAASQAAIVSPFSSLPPSHWREDCHFDEALSPSLLKHLLEVEGGYSRMTVSPTAIATEPVELARAEPAFLHPEQYPARARFGRRHFADSGSPPY